VPSITPDTPTRFLPSVGPGRAKVLDEHDLRTAGDLLWFFPKRYEDRRHPTRIADLGRHVDTPVLLRGKVISAHARVSPLKRMRIFEIAIEDGSGAVKVVWFNQQYLADQIKRGNRIAVYGMVRLSPYGHLQIESADWEVFEGDGEEEGSIVRSIRRWGRSRRARCATSSARRWKRCRRSTIRSIPRCAKRSA